MQASAERLAIGQSQVSTTNEGIGTAILNALTSQFTSVNQANRNQSLQYDLITAIYQDGEAEEATRASALSIPRQRQERLQKVFLHRLHFSGMNDREGRIPQAHAKTFQWIFEDGSPQQSRWSNFRDWLESDSQLYWITGKAGSGKSTLMKYICQPYNDVSSRSTLPDKEGQCQSRCWKHLRKWAGALHVITAVFYFWNSGAELQMSQRGLLLSLLYQLIQQVPYLIPTISPKRWEALCLFNDDRKEWSNQELHRTLRAAAREISQNMKLCLFVDGLDEFDGKHSDLIHLFQDLIQDSKVKVCVASRPWVIFEDAFQHKPSMMLQDLTYSDIKSYVMSSFQDDSGFTQLQRREPEYGDQLIENVVSKASGVFLWVHLVVASLLAGMGFGDRVSDLQKRLESLPSDLERLYDKILQSLDPFYLEHAAQLFKLVQESPEPPSLALLSFADEENLDIHANENLEALPQNDLALRTDTMRRRLNSRCKGFLEVGTQSRVANGDTAEETVQYLHRTVKDYVESKEAQDTLNVALKSDFDPHYRLCAGNLAYLKAIGASKDYLIVDGFWARVQQCLYSAAHIQPANRVRVVSLLDELDKTRHTLAKRKIIFMTRSGYVHKSEIQNALNMFETREWARSHPALRQKSVYGGTFLSLVVRYGITEYVEAKADQGCLVPNNTAKLWPLLLDAVYLDPENTIGLKATTPRPDMINCLLAKGADPNYPIHGIESLSEYSIWKLMLQYIVRQGDNLEPKSPWFEIAESMVRHGARVEKGMILDVQSPAQLVRDGLNRPLFDQLREMQRRNPRKGFSWRFKSSR